MKRILMATVIGALVASTATLSSPPAAMADERDVRSQVPKPPRTVILAANLERNGHWYALSSKQIASVGTLLTRPPYYNPPDVDCVILPALGDKIILWAAGDQGLVAEDVVECHDKMQFLYSTKRGRFYEANDTPERDELLKLIDAIKDGRDKGVEAETK
jgi:hypothetical protein